MSKSKVYVIKNSRIEEVTGIIPKDALAFVTPNQTIDYYVEQKRRQFKQIQQNILKGLAESKNPQRKA